jgi:uracil phosphoribosyltransferase
MVFVIGGQDSIANQFLLELRDKHQQQDKNKFRKNMKRLGQIMAYEISKHFIFSPHEVETPLGKTVINIPEQPVLLTILRAGLPYFEGFQEFFSQANSGFIGAFRKEGGEAIEIQLDYTASPDLNHANVILIDPMLATGRSTVDAISALKKFGTPDFLHLASVVASPEGILHVQKNVSLSHSIYTFAIDEKLNDQFYIVPGLGDAGDLSYGAKK